MHTWGGGVWRGLIEEAFTYFGDLRRKRVLEIGFRDGTMCREFALRGAEVTGLETDPKPLVAAQRNTHGLPVQLLSYDGNLDAIEGQFDVIFSKSVLVLTDLESFLPQIRRKLRGKFAFIENGRGNAVMQVARKCFRTAHTYGNVRYFDESSLRAMREHLPVERVIARHVPPVYLICGHTK